MLSCMIDEMEVQDAETYEIPEAFLKIDDDKGDIYIKMEGVVETLLENINLA